MAGLLYKELILNKKNFILIGIGILILSIFAVIPAPLDDIKEIYPLCMAVIAVMIFMYTGAAQQGIYQSDESEKWAHFVISTPLSYKGQVLSKYYFSLLISITAVVYCTFLFGINAIVQGGDSGVMSIVMILFVIQLLLRAIEFPFVTYFGGKYGNKIRLCIAFMAIFFVIVYLLFGDMSIFGSFESFMDWFTGFINGSIYTDVMLIAVAVVPIVVVIIYYLSYKLSCVLYRKGVSNYEE